MKKTVLKETFRVFNAGVLKSGASADNFEFTVIKQGYGKTFQYRYISRNGEHNTYVSLLGDNGWNIIGNKYVTLTKVADYIEENKVHLDHFAKIEKDFDSYIAALYEVAK
jgi:hypothetical protein